jgi:hypothetical protein
MPDAPPHPQIIIEKHVVIIQNLDLLFLELTTYLRPQAEIFFNKFKLNSFKPFFFQNGNLINRGQFRFEVQF